jgi:hypothetical protein
MVDGNIRTVQCAHIFRIRMAQHVVDGTGESTYCIYSVCIYVCTVYSSRTYVLVQCMVYVRRFLNDVSFLASNHSTYCTVCTTYFLQ